MPKPTVRAIAAAEQKHAVVSLLADVTVSPSRTRIKPLFDQRSYRGKQQWVVGYSWSKAGSGLMSGTVYDAILGWGESFELALAHAQNRAQQ